MSPSPSRKKNSWKDEEASEETTKKEKKKSPTKPIPKIPVAHKTQSHPHPHVPPHPLAKSGVE
jgi:hypothetical protein